MKLIILAAGRGSRLWPLTKNTPKSLIDLGNGTTLLERQLDSALQSGCFNEIIIVTGYKGEQIDAKLIEYKKHFRITTVYNPFYDVSNNLISLWVVHYKLLEDDFLVTNGDNIYRDSVFGRVCSFAGSHEEIIAITIDRKREYDEDDMKVILDANSHVVNVSKEIPPEEANAESVGLALVKGDKSRQMFVEAILDLVKAEDGREKFWLEVFNFLVNKGYIVETIEIAESEWKEVDFHPDVEILRKIVLDGF